MKQFYGHTTVKGFGPLALKAVRQKMIDGYEHPKYGPQRSLCRGVVNQRVGRIRRMFKWAVENELVPPPCCLDCKQFADSNRAGPRPGKRNPSSRSPKRSWR